MAGAVPASAGLFIELNRIAADDSSSRTRDAYHLYELLTGSPESGEGTTHWPSTILDSLGIKPGEGARDLLSHQLAIAAPSWKKLAEGILVVRLSPPDTLMDQVFAPDNVDSIDGKGKVIVYRTQTRLHAATNGDLLVISRRNHARSLYRKLVRHMLTGRGVMLAGDRNFQNQVRDLPPGRDGTVYVSFHNPDKSSAPGNLFSLGLTRMALGIYFKPDHVDFAFRGTRAQARNGPRRSAVSLARLKQLPLTTVAAWCTEFDVGKAFRMLLDRQLDQDAPPYIKLFMEILDVDRFEGDLVDNLGPGAIIAWDQHLGTGAEIPQIALLLESRDAPRCATAFANAMQVVVNWFDIKNRGKPDRLKLTRTDYLGTTIYEVSLPTEPALSPTHSGSQVTINPAFAAVTDSFVLALGADHIRNIVDAHMGLAPTLTSLRELASFTADPTPPFMLGFAQPALAASILDDWLNQSDGLVNRWLRQTLGSRGWSETPGAGTPRLGIGIQPGKQPGTVLVVRVDRNEPAHGRLRPGDQVLGVNGNLLSLSNSTTDLRRLVTDAASTGRWVFRVQRDGDYREVTVSGSPRAQAAVDPSSALRQLRSMFKRVDFGSIRAVETAPDRIRADLTLRFTPSPSQG